MSKRSVWTLSAGIPMDGSALSIARQWEARLRSGSPLIVGMTDRFKLIQGASDPGVPVLGLLSPAQREVLAPGVLERLLDREAR